MRFIALLSLVLGFYSCQKQPVADFTTDKTEYFAGDTIKLTNTSLDAYKYKWIMPDNQTSNAVNVNYYSPESLNDGSMTFILQAMSKNSKKTDEATKSVKIKTAEGQLTVWSSDTYSDSIAVSIDNILNGYVTKTYPNSAPDCGADGCLNVTLKIGPHSISATRGGVKWTGIITVFRSKCSKFKLGPVPLN